MRRAAFNVPVGYYQNASRRQRRPARLRLEALEERVVPSLFGAAIIAPVASTEFGTGPGLLPGFVSGHFQSNGRDQLAVVNLAATGANELVLMDVLNGNFETVSSAPTQLTVLVAAADFNGDGKLDLMGETPSGLVTLLGNGDGTFKAPINLGDVPSGNGPIALGDFTGDGKIDLATQAPVFQEGVSVFAGNGDGSFQPARISLTKFNFGPNSVKAADFNNDGKLDLVGVSFTGNLVVLLGNGDGTFTPSFNTTAGIEPSDVEAGDLNGDGKLDLVLTNNFANSISVLYGNGDGTFGLQQVISIGLNQLPWASVLGDFNGDGKLDIAISTNHGPPTVGQVTVLLGNGNGTFAPPQVFPSGFFSRHIAAGDFTGNGRLDLAVFDNPQGGSDGQDVQIAVLPNTSVSPAKPLTANQVYVQFLYLDLLHRLPDPSGFAFFSGLLDNGVARRRSSWKSSSPPNTAPTRSRRSMPRC
jgi:hypothetical protein